MRGYDAAHLEPRPDLVVVGNVCAQRQPRGPRRHRWRASLTVSMPGALEELFLAKRQSFVVAGTHGKTTTTALVTYLLQRRGARRRATCSAAWRATSPRALRSGATAAPFVIEGDEYDSAFFEKQPKFFRYRPFAAILTSIEHDHIDIYPTPEAYRAAFVGFVERIPEAGLLVAYAGDPEVRAIAQARALPRRATTRSTATTRATSCPPGWPRPRRREGGVQPFDLFFGGSASGRVHSPLSGQHNVKNALAAIALCAEGAGQRRAGAGARR